MIKKKNKALKRQDKEEKRGVRKDESCEDKAKERKKGKL